MSIPFKMDPMGYVEDWYNWTPAVFTTKQGDMEFSITYLISDFVPVSAGSFHARGTKCSVPGYDYMLVVTYDRNKRYYDCYGGYSAVIPDKVHERVDAYSNGGYVRLQVLRDYYEYALIKQGDKVLLDGPKCLPEPL